VDRLGIYSNLHIVHCGPQGLTYLRDGEPSMSATTAPPDAQLSVKHQVPANLADGPTPPDDVASSFLRSAAAAARFWEC
jgi:hypothetical protein